MCAACLHVVCHYVINAVAPAIALLFAEELEEMCSPVPAFRPGIAKRNVSGALRSRVRGSRQQRSSPLVRAGSDDVQLALARSLAAHEAAGAGTAASAHSDGIHIREEVIDLRFDGDASIGSDEAVEAHIDDLEDSPTSATLRRSPTEFRRPQRRISDSISDATIERLTGLSLH